MKTKEWMQTLIDIKDNYGISSSEKKIINAILLHFDRMYIKRQYKKSPNLSFKVRMGNIKRVQAEALTKQILYVMQLNKTPVSFRNLTHLFKNPQYISVSLNSLIKTQLVKRIAYAVYELTGRGRDYVV